MGEAEFRGLRHREHVGSIAAARAGAKTGNPAYVAPRPTTSRMAI